MALAVRHRVVLTIAALAIVAAAAALLERDDPSPAEPTIPRATPAAPATPPRAPHRVVAPATAAAPDAAKFGDPLPDTADLGASEDDGFPAIDVEVVRADGSPAGRAQVYALRAGAAGRDAFEDGPHAKTHTTLPAGPGAGGTCRLFVARAGTYDVGAVAGPFHAMARDVAIPSAGPVRIELPPQDDAVVVATPSAVARLVPDGRHQPINWTLAADDGVVLHAFPGRAEALAWTDAVRFGVGENECRVRLPAGATVRVTSTDEFAATPQAVRVPATVHVDLSHRYFVALTIDVDAADAAAADGVVELAIDPGPGGTPPARPVTLNVPEERARAMLRVRTLPRFAVGAEHGTIRWSGRGVVPGSADFDGFVQDVDNLLDVTIRLDGTPLPTAAATGRIHSATSVRLRITDPTGGADPVNWLVARASGDAAGATARPGEEIAPRLIGPSWIVAWRGDQFAGPVLVAPTADTVNELTLGPGGCVSFFLEAAPPKSLGTVTVELADGGLFLCGGLVRRSAVGTERGRVIEMGSRIGPMAPGDHEFVVRAGGEEIGRVTAHVIAGATIGERIPRLSPR